MAVFLPESENFLALPEAQSRPETSGAIVIPVPFEATTTYGKGAADGPAALLTASHEVELFDASLGFEPYAAAGGIATQTPLDVQECDGDAVALRVHEEVSPWLRRGKFVVVLGGEHTSVVGTIRAHCEFFEGVTVLQLDAHSDLRPQYLDEPWNHACAMARVLDFHEDLVQAGIRSQDADERRLSEARGLPVFYAHDIHGREACGEDWIGALIAATQSRVYVTLDCDVFDPSILPATGTPEPGGLTWWQVDALLRRLCAAREVVGFDVNELAPIPGMRHSEFTLAKLTARLIGYRFKKNRREYRG